MEQELIASPTDDPADVLSKEKEVANLNRFATSSSGGTKAAYDHRNGDTITAAIGKL